MLGQLDQAPVRHDALRAFGAAASATGRRRATAPSRLRRRCRAGVATDDEHILIELSARDLEQQPVADLVHGEQTARGPGVAGDDAIVGLWSGRGRSSAALSTPTTAASAWLRRG